MQTYIKIIDNKKLALTQSEWDLYQSICRSYDRANFKGEELFKDLWESDDQGIIIFLKPPTSRYTSIEVFLYVVAVFQHQHMRQMHSQLKQLMGEVRAKLQEVTIKEVQP
jgi:hypothetical protein